MDIEKKIEMEARQHALSLVSTSVDDMQSSLPYFESKSQKSIQILEFALAICQRRGEKTKATLLARKLRKMKKEVETQRKLGLTNKSLTK
jgi:hypothetical protein